MVDPQLKAQFRQKMAYAAPTGVGVDGDLIYLERPVIILARVEPVDRTRELGRGTRLDTTFRIYTEAEIQMDYRVWLPGENFNVREAARRPKFILELVDENGVLDHYEIEV